MQYGKKVAGGRLGVYQVAKVGRKITGNTSHGQAKD